MGLGMMGGSSPYAGVNIGRGGLQGLQFAENQKLRQAQQADTAAYRQAVTDNRRYGIDTRAGTAADSTAARVQIAQMLNDRVNFWKSKGFNELTANQKAMQDIRSQTLDLNTQKAAVTADQRQQGLDQGAQRVQQAKESFELRQKALGQTQDLNERKLIQSASANEIRSAANVAGSQAIPFAKALTQIRAASADAGPPRLPAAQGAAQQPAAPAGVTRVQSPEEAMKLPSGTQFMGPDGVLRQRP